MKDLVYSEVTHLNYDARASVRLVNTRQAMLYIKNNCTLYDLYESDGSLVFIFDRKESAPLYDLWCKRELV